MVPACSYKRVRFRVFGYMALGIWHVVYCYKKIQKARPGYFYSVVVVVSIEESISRTLVACRRHPFSGEAKSRLIPAGQLITFVDCHTRKEEARVNTPPERYRAEHRNP